MELKPDVGCACVETKKRKMEKKNDKTAELPGVCDLCLRNRKGVSVLALWSSVRGNCQ